LNSIEVCKNIKSRKTIGNVDSSRKLYYKNVKLKVGSTAILTLLEEFEFEYLQVQDLGRMAGRRKWSGILAIQDGGGVPGYRFEGPWIKVS